MEIYTVKVAVKPYTKSYLENNYGNPADIRQDPELNDMVTMMLREGSTRLDKIISSNFPATVELRITKDTVFRKAESFLKIPDAFRNRIAQALMVCDVNPCKKLDSFFKKGI